MNEWWQQQIDTNNACNGTNGLLMSLMSHETWDDMTAILLKRIVINRYQSPDNDAWHHKMKLPSMVEFTVYVISSLNGTLWFQALARTPGLHIHTLAFLECTSIVCIWYVSCWWACTCEWCDSQQGRVVVCFGQLDWLTDWMRSTHSCIAWSDGAPAVAGHERCGQAGHPATCRSDS